MRPPPRNVLLGLILDFVLRTARVARLVLPLALIAACAGPGIRTGKPVRFAGPPSKPAGEEFPNWPIPPVTDLTEYLAFDREPYDIVTRKGAGGGVTGAAKFHMLWDHMGEEFEVKAKRAPDGRLDGWNNAPRKEIAADMIQRLFLDPADFVVPTTGAICIPMDKWEESYGPSKPSYPGIDCVVTNFSVWLQDVTVPDSLYDEQRFVTDPRYAWHLANFNILTYLINQRDGRRGNFLVAKDDSRRIVFSIDNGVTFGAKVYNWFNPPSYAWTKIKVAALPRQAVDRLRKLRREDLDSLLVVAQLERDSEGLLLSVPPGPAINPNEGVSIQGTTVQMGLTKGEVDAVWGRITRLIEAVDQGRMPVF